MAPQPHEAVWNLATAVVASRALHVVAELGVADHLADQPVPPKELARRCDADPDGLERLLRLLCTSGIFSHDDAGFSHTEASRLLCSDHPMSMRAFPRMFGLPVFTASLAQLEHSARTGAPAIEQVEPRGLWAHLAEHPDEAAVFGQSMAAKAAADVAAVLAAYDFGRFGTIADVGGGQGHLLAAILEAAPASSGILFDLPPVIDTVRPPTDRLRLHPGDFFDDELPGADAYLLMEVIHDWDDAHALRILKAIRRAAEPGATVLIIEGVVDPQRPDPRVHTLDVIMLALTGGRERTAAALGELLAGAGFRPGAVIDTPGPMRIAEGIAV
jgi:C-methyltransferase